MQKILLIYNPVAGTATFKDRLDEFIELLQKKNFAVTVYRTRKEKHCDQLEFLLRENEFSKVIVSGGDGTVSKVLQAMQTSSGSIPLAILPSGTSNDFARHIGMGEDLEANVEIITQGETINLDVGQINDNYFINVVSIGSLPSIAHKTATLYKNNLGALAYYLKGIGQVPAFKPFDVTLEFNGKQVSQKAFLILVLNSGCAGGFKRLAPKASLSDGLFDILLIKDCNLGDKLSLFLKVLKGEHDSDHRLEYFQTERVKISGDKSVDTDVDGEQGPDLPIDISFCKKVPLIVNKNKEAMPK
ncbi:YegS/Rv2252/BmrU family lipid kinase [Proteinivorax hydrogeniformans]|uniref:YegS/Rv2252/BmrU family lipid kinase n=1 Tax=Proteinivorax hydrogeniformans TaxID=1826727 RepID=A0AAU8HVY8_9FIRM